MFSALTPDVIGVFIPIVFIIGGIFIVITVMIMNGRKKELEHKERIMAMEKGIPLPEPPAIKEKSTHTAHTGKRTSALSLIGIGLGLIIALWVVTGPTGGVWGFIPLFMGIGQLLSSHLDHKEKRSAETKTSGGTAGGLVE